VATEITHLLREFPPVTTVHAFTERRHRLVCTPGLGLTIADLLLLALAALELSGNSLFNLRNHGLIHVFFFELFVLGTAGIRLHLVVRHDDKLLGWDVAGEDALAELGVGFVLEVLEEGAHLALVGLVYTTGVFVRGGFDLFCDSKNLVWHWSVD
jgi:hypothetical protein